MGPSRSNTTCASAPKPLRLQRGYCRSAPTSPLPGASTRPPSFRKEARPKDGLRTAEVRLLVLLDVERGQELGVEVARREAEARPVVVVDDPHDVCGAHLIDGARDAVLPMVVRRDGERPGAQPLIGAGEVSGRAVCR